MGRNKKDGVAEPEVVIRKDASSQLADALDEMKRGGGEVQVRYRIFRRFPGESLWRVWKTMIDCEAVGDIQEFCYKDGGDECEYRVMLVDSTGRKIRRENGESLPQTIVPARKAVSVAASVSGIQRSDDEIIREREAQLLRRSRMASIKAREIEVRNEELRLKKEEQEPMRKRDRDEDDGDDLFGDGPRERPRVMSRSFPSPYPQPYPPGYPPPWAREQETAKSDRSHEMMMAMMNQNTQIIIAALSNNKPQHDDGFAKMLPLILGQQMKPQDFMGVMMPLMGEAMKLQGEGARSAMESMGEMQKSVFGQIVKAMLADGRPDDEIDKVKRIAGIVTDGLQEVTKTVLGRESILRPGQEVKVPLIGGPKPIPKTPPPLQAPATTNATPAPKPTPPVNPGAATPETHPPPVADDGAATSPVDPVKAAAQEVTKNRINAFLEGHEQEMLADSEPGLVADELEKLYLSLPRSLRNTIEDLEVAEIYEEFRKRSPEIVARILAAVKEDASRLEWCEEFWTMMRTEQEEEPEPAGETSPEPEEANAP